MSEIILDPKVLPEKIAELQRAMNTSVIGQERAVKQVIKAYVPMSVKIHREGRPLGVFLFLGPTGVGKTETVRTLAKKLLNSRDAITRVDCAEFGEHHEVAKLIGAPPGYIGSDKEPRLSQEAIDKFQTKENKVNILLFDEIEKAHPRLFDTILTILGDARLTLGNGKTVDFSKTLIFLTTNLGSKDIAEVADSSGIGFTRVDVKHDEVEDIIYRKAKESIKKQFRPEFLNRIDNIVVFRRLEKDSLLKILDIQLADLQWRIWSSPWRDMDFPLPDPRPKQLSVTFRLTDAAKDFMLAEGTSAVYGAREMNRAVDRFLQFPIASLIAAEQVVSEDRILIDHRNKEEDLTFIKLDRL